MITMHLQGANEALSRLEELKTSGQKKVARRGLRTAGEVLLMAARAAARNRVGRAMGRLLARALILRAHVRRRADQEGMTVKMNKAYNDQFVYFAKGKRNAPLGQRSYIPFAIEYGHVAPDGKRVEAIPFMRTSFDANAEGAIMAAEAAVKDEMEKL